MTNPHDDDPAELLRDAWQRALDVPPPLDADDEPADPTTAAAVDWTRRAWRAQAAPPVAPDLAALVARRRDGPPAAPPAPAPRRRAVRWREAAAVAALVLATLGPVAWLLHHDRGATPITLAPAPPVELTDAPAPRATEVADVAVASAPDGSLELVSGPVRLVLVAPTAAP